MAREKNVAQYLMRLAIFALVCVVGGVIVLILAFAPATNPGFLAGGLYRGNNHEDLRGLKKVAVMFTGNDSPVVRLYDNLLKDPSDSDFRDLGLEKPETASIKTADGQTLDGWFFKGSGPDTVLVCYNGFGKRLPLYVGYINMFREAGLSAFLFDYRGLNDAHLKPTPQTACIDSQAAYDYLTKTKAVSPEHLIILGRDLGAYAALKVAQTHKCKALVLENPWGTVKRFVESVPGAIAMRMVPESLYTEDCLNNIHLVSKDHPPILVVSVDPEITDAGTFYQAIPAPKAYLYVEEYMPTLLAPNLTEDRDKYTERLKTLAHGDALPAPETGTINWLDDYKSALARAKQINKPLLAEFGAPWCIFCRKMDQTTYVDSEVAAKLNTDYVPVRLDTTIEDNQQILDKFSVRGIPAVLVFDGAGNMKGKIVGFQPPGKFLKSLSNIK